jgi:hypothetical protein
MKLAANINIIGSEGLVLLEELREALTVKQKKNKFYLYYPEYVHKTKLPQQYVDWCESNLTRNSYSVEKYLKQTRIDKALKKLTDYPFVCVDNMVTEVLKKVGFVRIRFQTEQDMNLFLLTIGGRFYKTPTIDLKANDTVYELYRQLPEQYLCKMKYLNRAAIACSLFSVIANVISICLR